MRRAGPAYWTWPAQDWADLIGVGADELRQSCPGQVGSSARPYLLAYAYLLGGFTAFDHVGRFHRQSLAWRCSAKARLTMPSGRSATFSAGWGYHCERDLTSVAICQCCCSTEARGWRTCPSETLARLRADPAMGQ